VATAITKPAPTEHGKTPAANKPRSQSKSWERNERDTAHWFTKNDGPDPEMQHVVTSSGRCGMLTHLQYDTASAHYCVEVKRRESAPSWLRDCWDQIQQVAASRVQRYPVLVLYLPGTTVIEGKQFPRKAMHCITPERHQQLLECERQIEENNVSTAIR